MSYQTKPHTLFLSDLSSSVSCFFSSLSIVIGYRYLLMSCLQNTASFLLIYLICPSPRRSSSSHAGLRKSSLGGRLGLRSSSSSSWWWITSGISLSGISSVSVFVWISIDLATQKKSESYYTLNLGQKLMKRNWIWHVNDIPTMQFWTKIPNITRSKWNKPPLIQPV